MLKSLHEKIELSLNIVKRGKGGMATLLGNFYKGAPKA